MHSVFRAAFLALVFSGGENNVFCAGGGKPGKYSASASRARRVVRDAVGGRYKSAGFILTRSRTAFLRGAARCSPTVRPAFFSCAACIIAAPRLLGPALFCMFIPK
jgi:hypothetical protein|tara:strand:- start:3684 stop:4001 length:318 start_codon:yes stop_codon:yes gene_type:complete